MKNYEVIDCFSLADLYAYCEVENLHFVGKPQVAKMVAEVELSHNTYAILDLHTQKAYIIFLHGNVTKAWAKNQAFKCHQKYELTGAERDVHDAQMNELNTTIDEFRRANA